MAFYESAPGPWATGRPGATWGALREDLKLNNTRACIFTRLVGARKPKRSDAFVKVHVLV